MKLRAKIFLRDFFLSFSLCNLNQWFYNFFMTSVWLAGFCLRKFLNFVHLGNVVVVTFEWVFFLGVILTTAQKFQLWSYFLMQRYFCWFSNLTALRWIRETIFGLLLTTQFLRFTCWWFYSQLVRKVKMQSIRPSSRVLFKKQSK